MFIPSISFPLQLLPRQFYHPLKWNAAVLPAIKRLHVPLEPLALGRLPLELAQESPRHEIRLGALVEAELLVPSPEEVVCLLGIDCVRLLEQTLHQFLVWMTEAFAEARQHNLVREEHGQRRAIERLDECGRQVRIRVPVEIVGVATWSRNSSMTSASLAIFIPARA